MSPAKGRQKKDKYMDPLRFGETRVRPEAMETGLLEGTVDENGRAIFTHEITFDALDESGKAPEEPGAMAPGGEKAGADAPDQETTAGDTADDAGGGNDTGGGDGVDSSEAGADAPGPESTTAATDGGDGHPLSSGFERAEPAPASRAMKLRRGDPPTTAELLASKPEMEIDTSMYDINYHADEFVKMSAAKVSKKQFDFVLPGLAVGDVGLLVAPGGMGKTVMATVMALRVALGMDGLTAGGVIMICAEDDETSLQIRLRGLAESYRLNDADIELADRNLVCWPCSGMGVDITSHDDTDSNRLQHKIYNIVRGHNWADRPRLLVLDTLRRMSSLLENSNDDMSLFIKICEKIARRTGMAILIVHHASKTTVLNGNAGTQQAARGGSALVDNAKFCSHLLQMTVEEAEAMEIEESERKKLVKYTVSKCNRGPTPAPCWYEREENGSLIPRRVLKQKSDPAAKDGRKAALRESIIRQREQDAKRTPAQRKKCMDIFLTYGEGVLPQFVLDKMEAVVDSMPEAQWDAEIERIAKEYREGVRRVRPIRDFGGLLPPKKVATGQTGQPADAGGKAEAPEAGQEQGKAGDGPAVEAGGQTAADGPAPEDACKDAPDGGNDGQVVNEGEDTAQESGPVDGSDAPAENAPEEKTE